jgi:GGDEF domain-containing protein
MDPGRSQDPARQNESDDGDGGSPGGLGLAPDDATSAFDDERVRRVIDGLLHPGEASPDRPVARANHEPTLPTDRPGPARFAVDELGLCRADTWHRLFEAEHARVARYGTKTTVVQLEIADIGLIATLLGEAAADRLVRVLADTVRVDSRRADTYSRIGHWRIAGLLPQTDGRTADHSIERIQDAFRRRLGDRLPVGLMAGRAEINPNLNPAATLARAEGSMHLEAHAPGEPGWEAGPATVRVQGEADPVDAAAATSSVTGRLRVLDRLHQEGLVTDDEYRLTRLEILRRI